MDARRFDVLTRTLSSPDTRRRVLGVLASAPLLGGLVTFLDQDEAEGRKRRERRKDRHRRRKGKADSKRRKRRCKPKRKAKVCAGRCGVVKNRKTCGKRIDCGPCDCDPPCGECFTCQGNGDAPGTCVPRTGAPCGQQTCKDGVLQPQGTCNGSGTCVAAAPVSCDPYVACANATTCATTCSNDSDCATGYFCDGAQCQAQQDNGTTCQTGEQCASGYCVDDVCCVAASCGTCQVCDASGDGTCTVVPDGTACGSGDVCCDGTCQECCDQSDCGANTICVNGTCEACDVTCSGNAATCGDDLQAALEDEELATVYVCPGTYQGGFELARAATVIGAGAGQTILDGNEAMRVLGLPEDVEVTLEALTLTNGTDAYGGGAIHSRAKLTLIDADLAFNTVTNQNYDGGGGAIFTENALTLRNTIVHNNTSDTHGGGIAIEGGTLSLEAGSRIAENTTQYFGGGIWNYEGTVTLRSGSQVTGNESGLPGGALYNDEGSVTIEEDVLICGNTIIPQCYGSDVTGTCPESATCPA